jgi:hypothetical protein
MPLSESRVRCRECGQYFNCGDAIVRICPDCLVEKPSGLLGEFNTVDWDNRTYYCGNCGCPRRIDDHCIIVECPQCGDDESDALVKDYEVP